MPSTLNSRLRSIIERRYLIRDFKSLKCPSNGSDRYWLSLLIANAMLGLVRIAR